MTPVSFFIRQGISRSELQDCVLVGPLMVNRATAGPMSVEVDLAVSGLVGVFDGMGGHAAGRRASMLGAAQLADLLRVGQPFPGRRPRLEWAIVEAGRRIVDESEMVSAWSGMGTTVVGVHFDGPQVRGFNVGDSRAYLMQDRYLCQYSRDHVAVKDDPGSALTQCLGGGLREIEPHVTDLPWDWDRSPVALLCSDGLHRHVGIELLEEAVSAPDSIGALWHLAAGAVDDVGVVLIDGRRSHGSLTATGDEGSCHDQPQDEELPDVGSDWRRKLRFGGPHRRARVG